MTDFKAKAQDVSFLLGFSIGAMAGTAVTWITTDNPGRRQDAGRAYCHIAFATAKTAEDTLVIFRNPDNLHPYQCEYFLSVEEPTP